jgi:hypothetical protein
MAKLTEDQKQALRERTFSKMTGGNVSHETPERKERVDVPVGVPEHPNPVLEEDREEPERQYTSVDAKGDAALNDYYENLVPKESGNSTFEASEQKHGAELEVDDIAWDEDGSPYDIATANLSITAPSILENLVIPANMPEEEKEKLSEQAFSYIGDVPVHISRYTNRWIKCLGVAAVPLAGNVIDQKTGETEWKEWVRPLFKLDKIDPDTGEYIIAYGGGQNGLKFVRFWNSLTGKPGDWKKPRWIFVRMETRENQHILYHFRHRITPPVKES